MQRVPVPQGKDWEKGVAFTLIIVDSLLEAGERERGERGEICGEQGRGVGKTSV